MDKLKELSITDLSVLQSFCSDSMKDPNLVHNHDFWKQRLVDVNNELNKRINDLFFNSIQA